MFFFLFIETPCARAASEHRGFAMTSKLSMRAKKLQYNVKVICFSFFFLPKRTSADVAEMPESGMPFFPSCSFFFFFFSPSQLC